MDDLENLYLSFHIPRTGGTFFNYAIGHWSKRKHHLTHYNYTENYSSYTLRENELPWLRWRTNEQQRQLKVMSGHSIVANSINWTRIQFNPKYLTVVRDPVERTLSSFNFRHKKATLTQDHSFFSSVMPQMNNYAIATEKSAEDYDTLYQYLKDNKNEHNLQIKWLAKSFFRYNMSTNQWETYPGYVDNIELATSDTKEFSLTLGEWMQYDISVPDDVTDYILSKMWHVIDFNNLEKDTRDFCNFVGLEYQERAEKNSSSSELVPHKWTLEEVKNQKDYHRLLTLLEQDIKLYETIKQRTRPY